jgi:CheY-like chemotaxis protein
MNSGRVLIVDDREDVLEALASVANGLGYECDRAATTTLAASLLAERRYDAVLLDIQMPGKSGAQLAAETRAGHGPNRETRLLGMSAAEVTALYSDGPFDACLTKPIDRNALASALREEWPESWPISMV